MDRFEVFKTIENIPDNELYLHSSMDRFEVFSLAYPDKVFRIYIPVWIDLKNYIIFKKFISTVIYIPVWIDLKASAKQPGVYLALGSVFCLPAL